MPFNTLHVPDHLPAQTCQAINAMLHACLVQTCGVHPDHDFCLVSRYAEQDMMLHPTFLGCRDPSNTIVIEIVLLGGRTDEQKEALYASVRQGLADMGFAPGNAIIFIVENRAIDWSFGEAGSVKRALGM